MVYEIRSWFRVETTRLLWLIGVLFALVITFQFLELPYGGYVLSSLFPSHEVREAENTDSVEKVADVNGVNIAEGNTPLILENSGNFNAGLGFPSPAPSPIDLSTGVGLVKNADENIGNPVISNNSVKSSMESNMTPGFGGDEKPVPVEEPDNLPLMSAPKVKKVTEKSRSAVITIYEMNNLLNQSVSYHSATRDGLLRLIKSYKMQDRKLKMLPS